MGQMFRYARVWAYCFYVVCAFPYLMSASVLAF